MRAIFAAAAVLSLTTGGALAADMGIKAAPAAAMPAAVAGYSWTGPYVGATAGYVWGKAELTDVDGYNLRGSSFDYRPNGGIFSARAGYLYQTGLFVVGAEGELGYLGLDDSAQYPPYVGSRGPNDSVASVKTDFYAALTARVGFTPIDRLLVYGKGGAAFVNLKTSFIDTDPAGITLVSGTSKTEFKPGWTLGAGVEYALDAHWSLSLEYDHFDFGKQSHTAVTSGGADREFEHRVYADAVRLGVSYKFGGLESPIVAKY